MKLVITENWDQTLFYLATLSLVFFGGFVVRTFAG
ncbi:MAG: hypothetical protein H6P94_324 [Thermoplasmatales archaeon]|jgi:hypothetical protein|nr:hypothetical protein [Thermoplasmatales archaeon]